MKYYVTVAGREIEVEVDGDRVVVAGKTHRAALGRLPGTPIRHLLLDDRSYEFPMTEAARGVWDVTLRGEHWPVEVLDERLRHIRGLTAAAARSGGPEPVRAPMPGLVVRIAVTPGQPVAAGAAVAVLEAMKMENELKAPAAGSVKAVLVQPGQPVEKGEILVEFAADGASTDGAGP